MNYGLIASRVGHSFSDTIHAMLGNPDYLLCGLNEAELDEFMKKREFCAINVTIPYKQTVMGYLDFISDEAKKIGAVNTVVNKNGRLFGYNTDYFGMVSLIERTGLDLNNKKVLVLGSGGTSNTACYTAKQLGAKEIIKVSRTAKPGYVTYDCAKTEHSDAQIIINTTPCGMFPETDDMPVSLAPFKGLCGVIDAIFNPLRSRLVLEAQKRKIKAAGGLYMLVAQAHKAEELFFDKTIEKSEIERVYNELLNLKCNIAFIGMPQSGKTTVGKKTAELLNKEFVDTDLLIEQHCKMSIPDIFSKHGEAYFRKTEAEIIKQVSAKNGVVISTGGGCILNEENIKNLKSNSLVFFLNRSPENFYPTDSRPLANSIEKINELYKTRYPIYINSCDIIIENDKTADDAISAVINCFKKDSFI